MTSRTLGRVLAPAVIATAIAAGPPAASAATYDYDVTVKTTVDDKLHKAWGHSRNGGDRHFQFSSDLYSEMRGVRFTDGVIEAYVGGGQVDEDTAAALGVTDRLE